MYCVVSDGVNLSASGAYRLGIASELHEAFIFGTVDDVDTAASRFLE